jgi:hypothetical protein
MHSAETDEREPYHTLAAAAAAVPTAASRAAVSQSSGEAKVKSTCLHKSKETGSQETAVLLFLTLRVGQFQHRISASPWSFSYYSATCPHHRVYSTFPSLHACNDLFNYTLILNFIVYFSHTSSSFT